MSSLILFSSCLFYFSCHFSSSFPSHVLSFSSLCFSFCLMLSLLNSDFLSHFLTHLLLSHLTVHGLVSSLVFYFHLLFLSQLVSSHFVSSLTVSPPLIVFWPLSFLFCHCLCVPFFHICHLLSFSYRLSFSSCLVSFYLNSSHSLVFLCSLIYSLSYLFSYIRATLVPVFSLISSTFLLCLVSSLHILLLSYVVPFHVSTSHSWLISLEPLSHCTLVPENCQKIAGVPSVWTQTRPGINSGIDPGLRT